MNRVIMGVRDFGGLPEQVEAELSPHSPAVCTASNRWGTMLAVGCKNGDIVVYDMLTRGAACTLAFASLGQQSPMSVAAMAWSRSGHSLTAAYAKGLLCRWDMRKAKPGHTQQIQREITGLSIPDRTPVALITCAQGAPVLMQGDKRLELPAEKGARTLAAIDRSGTFIVLGATKGGVFLLDATSLQVLDALPVAAFRSMRISHDGKSIVLAGSSAVRRITLGQITAGHRSLGVSMEEAHAFLAANKGKASLLASRDANAPPLLGQVQDLRDPVSKSAWSCAEQSRDGEYVCGGAAVRDQHIIRIWEARSATLAVVLEGPPAGLHSVAWHPDPSRHILVSITTHGSVFVWAYMISQNWEVYAPGFRSLTQNEEYVESETEFDLSPAKGDDEGGGAEEPEMMVRDVVQIDVASWPGRPGLLYDSDTADDMAGAMFMAACRLDAPPPTAAAAAPQAADAEMHPVASDPAGLQARSKRPRDA